MTRPHRYEPEVNATYAEMAAHYGVAVIPARAYKPRDKAKAEAGVLLAERWIMARLRNRRFCSLAEANAAIAELRGRINDRPFKKLDGTRRQLFEELERPALRPLPATRYEFATWRKAKVNIDYHIEADRHYYSVPYQLVGQRVEVRLSAADGRGLPRPRGSPRTCARFERHGHTTDPAHMPEVAPPARRVDPVADHRAGPPRPARPPPGWSRRSWPPGPTPSRATAPPGHHPPGRPLRRRAARGRLRPGAARCAPTPTAASSRSCGTGLDRQPLPGDPAPCPPPRHDNLRGPGYYN